MLDSPEFFAFNSSARAKKLNRLTGIILILATSIIAALLVRRVLGSSSEAVPCAVAADATIPLLSPFVFWTLCGMEVGLLAFLLLLILRSHPIAGEAYYLSGSSQIKWSELEE